MAVKTPSPTKAGEALAFAEAASKTATTWIEFSNALFGVGAKLGELFSTEAEREAFSQTEEYRRIMAILREKLRSDNAEPSNGKASALLLRLPRSMHEGLKAEAEAEGVSVNQLCMAKLATQLRANVFHKC